MALIRFGLLVPALAMLGAGPPPATDAEHLLPGADRGDPRAEFALATLYDHGEDGRRDAARALSWYLRAANQGLPEAEFNAGVMLDAGDGAPADRALAAAWYARAAAHGHPRAAFNLAQLYAAGDGVPRNTDVAAAWFVASGLPAGRARVPALRDAPRPVSPDLSAPIPLDLAASEPVAADPVELAWTAPPQPARVRYVAQVVSLGPPVAPVADVTTDTTAALVARPSRPGPYAWRVYAVSAAAHHYAASAWRRFEVAAP